MRILITGGFGFIGSNYVRYHLKTHPDDEIIVLDNLTYAGNEQNIADVRDRITFKRGDICNPDSVSDAIDGCDEVIHFAAESHVDRSIDNAFPFIQTNVHGTTVLLDAARRNDIARFVQISTDEVYGSIQTGSFREDEILSPSSPYSASKAAGDLLCLSYYKTYGLPVVITRSTNNYGPYQHPEKFIPHMITRAIRDECLPVYGDGKNIRDWTYVLDNCRAIDCVRMKGKKGEIYNIGSHEEYCNIEIVQKILDILHKPYSLIRYVADRPGHDIRYSVDVKKVSNLGWTPQTKIEAGLEKTIQWYCEHSSWYL